MNKKMKILTTLGLALSCATVLAVGAISKGVFADMEKTYLVDFFDNYKREDFVLSNGTVGKGNNLLYKTVEVAENELVTKPEDPERKNYDFLGWYKEEKCVNAWNFASERVVKNTRLFAKWEYSQEEEGGEPTYVPPSTVLSPEADTDYVIDSIMYFKIKDGEVKVSNAAIAKLEASKTNVLPLMEYRVKDGKEISAVYDENKITITCGEVEEKIKVSLDGDYDTLPNDYETKAKKYEAKALDEESYHVMLAGSSSIEFWENYEEDLEPIVAYNHGIGGTTIEQWDNGLNQRLVFPYKPKMVVYYVGINNVINSKQSADVIWATLKDFMDHTHEALPDTKVQYIMMNLIPGFVSYWDTINKVNDQIVQYQKSNTWLTLINPGVALLKINGDVGVKAIGSKTNVVSNISLYAEWVDGEEESDKTYTVSFNANGGSAEMESETNIIGEYELPACTFNAPSGKHFVGWKINGQGYALNPTQKINVASDIELVAIWEGNTPDPTPITYIVRFNSNGGSGTMANVEGVAGDYKLPGSSFTAPEGKKFAGWRVYGEPNAAYFRIDGLHLSHYGYAIWGSLIKASIIEGLNK